MGVKRLRIFAGPNGSGKTTIVNDLKDKFRNHEEFSFGVIVNADEIEAQLHKTSSLLLNEYQISPDTAAIQSFFLSDAFSPEKLNTPNLGQYFSVVNNILKFTGTLINSYIAADVAEFIRRELLHSGVSFTYETVMSHRGKLAFMKQAKDLGYKVYLYYIATEDPEININRVEIRVKQHGHAVSPDKIRSRYYRSLELLKKAALLSNRAYIFDNSTVGKLIAEITEGKEVKMMETDPELTPVWFVKYMME